MKQHLSKIWGKCLIIEIFATVYMYVAFGVNYKTACEKLQIQDFETYRRVKERRQANL